LEEQRSKDLVKITSSWKNAKTNVTKAESDLDAARSLVTETKQAVVAKESDIATESQSIELKILAAKEAEERLARLTLDYQNMSAGISSTEGDEGRTLPEQISKAHSDSKSAEAKVQQASMKMKHLSKELKLVEKDLQKEGKTAEKMAQKRAVTAHKVEDCRGKLKDMGFSPEEFNALDQEKTDLEITVSELSERVDMLSAQLEGRLRFKYSDPVRGFDRSKVKGLVAKLIEVKDHKNATALEVVAGGKLYQVVVDEAITGKALLDRGKLERRVTIIPLDKIKPRNVSHTASELANDISQSLDSRASPAIELVGFDEEVRSAVEYVFGSTIVVDGMKAANAICDATKTRTVTLEGDVYDPSGTISGGSNNQLGTTLVKLTELTQVTSKLDEKRSLLASISMKVKSMATHASSYDKLSATLELAEAELSNIDKHLSQTSFGMLVEQRDSMAAELEAAQNESIEMEEEKEKKWTLFVNLQAQEAELTERREQRLAEIDQAVKDAKADTVEKGRIARQADSKSQTFSLELDSLQAEVAAAEEAVSVAEQLLDEATGDESKVQMKVGEVRALYEEAKKELDELDGRLNKYSAKLVELKRAKSYLVKEAEVATLEAKKLSVTITRIHKERSGAEKLVATLMKKYAWIDSEKSAFGVPGGDYDFEETNPRHVGQQLQSLKAEQESLSKKINKKVMGMIEKAEGEYTELLRKRKVVENDKKKIQAVIEELDVKKKSELERTWVKVNRDFGSIFSTLLPGAFAKLEPPDGMKAWEGLEVKVAFGDVWKDSLSELSGGQRSLLALSLILSLLLFKPAPMYILDEVDAALDLSHTQNIGNMLKTHFSQSQFVVVSLKEGMFNNANVIFRTKFVDGISTVTRTIGIGSSRNRALAESDNADSTNTSEKGRTEQSRRIGKENTVV
jgi:structural maintenance of chromosome 2